jgi:nicotinate-nucleotide adenylyltransferase
MPFAFAGQKIGLFGGSFDPAHAGHAHVAHVAQRALGLDAVWWLVSPQNPLKPESGPLADRLASAKAMAPGRKHRAMALETALGTRFTVDTLRRLRALYPGVRFVFVMGADGMASFGRWRRWRDILLLSPVFVVSRPGVGISARSALPFAPQRRRGADRRLASAALPAWAFAPARLHPQSSTALRLRQDGG